MEAMKETLMLRMLWVFDLRWDHYNTEEPLSS